MDREEIRSILESLLLVADGPQPLQRFAEVLDAVDRRSLQELLKEIQSDYESQNRGIRLVEVAGGYQLRTAKANAEWVKKYLGGRPARISKATLETLAIIAYRQPITKAEVEAIRGVDVDGVIATLLERNLIRAVARKDVPGRPFLYGTTSEFLQLFNLKDLSELPPLKDMDEISLPEVPGAALAFDPLEEK
ncbi:MAG TPA: SMC-Scp complex subunit ScpB [Candidatus Binatia bacterium]|jgi:segregation and condensation protein B